MKYPAAARPCCRRTAPTHVWRVRRRARPAPRPGERCPPAKRDAICALPRQDRRLHPGGPTTRRWAGGCPTSSPSSSTPPSSQPAEAPDDAPHPSRRPPRHGDAPGPAPEAPQTAAGAPSSRGRCCPPTSPAAASSQPSGLGASAASFALGSSLGRGRHPADLRRRRVHRRHPRRAVVPRRLRRPQRGGARGRPRLLRAHVPTSPSRRREDSRSTRGSPCTLPWRRCSRCSPPDGLAMVHAVGQPNPTRSHFTDMDEMERAAPGSSLRTGWLDRMVGATDHPWTVRCHRRSRPRSAPRSLMGPTVELAMRSIDSFKLAGAWDATEMSRWTKALQRPPRRCPRPARRTRQRPP